MAASKNDFRNVSLQNLVDNPDCSEDDVAQWVRDNSDKFEDDSHPGEFSQEKANKLFTDLMNNNSAGSSPTSRPSRAARCSFTEEGEEPLKWRQASA